MLSQLYAAHQAGGVNTGVDIESELPAVTDTSNPSPSAPIRDSYYVKWWALKFATKAACTVLQVDQVRNDECRIFLTLPFWDPTDFKVNGDGMKQHPFDSEKVGFFCESESQSEWLRFCV